MRIIKEDISTIHCLFEQSGTFKKEFMKLGFNALDYDIKDDFKQTDIICDLFDQINKAYYEEQSIFDIIKPDDLVFAFFPCVRFEDQIMLHFRGQATGLKNWTIQQKMNNCIKLHNELNDFYAIFNKLFIVCLDRNIKLIVENPYSEQHYLTRYWCFKPSIIDYDRRLRGDYFKKPTQYYFVNCQPSNNLIFEDLSCDLATYSSINDVNKSFCDKLGCKGVRVARSLISPVYANRFIREFIL